MRKSGNDEEHWERVIGVIVERLGVERFSEMLGYVLEQKGYQRLGVACELLRRMAAFKAEVEDGVIEDV